MAGIIPPELRKIVTGGGDDDKPDKDVDGGDVLSRLVVFYHGVRVWGYFG